MRKRIVSVLTAFILGLFLISGLEAARLSDAEDAGEAAGRSPGTRVSIDFRDVDIRVVAKFISDLTGKNFVFDKSVRDKVTVFSPTKVTPEEAYRLFETVLKVHGFTTVPTDGVVMVVPSQRARVMDVETRPRLPRRPEVRDDRVVTQLIRLKHADAVEMRTLLRPLMDKTGVLLAYESGNTLIVTDYGSNISRLLDIIRSIDVAEEGTRLSVIEIKHASARDMAAELEEILKRPLTKGKASIAGRVSYKVVPDERTNNLIVLARAPETKMIEDIVRRLDVPTPRGSDRVHVYFLKNAVAEELAKTLNELTGAKAGPKKPGAPKRLLLQEEVFITADKATNALIIRAERQDFLVLKDIIEKLDIQRAQVLVEALIMEMSFKKALAIGADSVMCGSLLAAPPHAVVM